MSAEKKDFSKNISFNRQSITFCLDLSFQNLTDEDIPVICKFLSENPDITELNLEGNKITDISIKHLIDYKIDLTVLNVADNNLGRMGADLISLIPSLIDLNISYNTIDHGINSLLAHKNLQKLNASKCDINNATMDNLRLNHKLTKLDLSYNPLTSRQLDNIVFNKYLTELILVACSLKKLDTSTLKNQASIISLNLRNNGINCTILISLKEMQKLANINIGGNNITKEVMVAFMGTGIVTKPVLSCVNFSLFQNSERHPKDPPDENQRPATRKTSPMVWSSPILKAIN